MKIKKCLHTVLLSSKYKYFLIDIIFYSFYIDRASLNLDATPTKFSSRYYGKFCNANWSKIRVWFLSRY